MLISYTPTLPAYRKLILHVLLSQSKGLLFIALFSLLTFIFTPLMLHSPEGYNIWAGYTGKSLGCLILPGLVLLIYIVSIFSIHKQWEKSPHLREEKVYELDDSGIHMKSHSMESFLDWKLFKTWTQFSDLIILKTHQNGMHFFSKSAIPDMALFEVLMKNKIPSKK